ncbi:saoe class I histocompatibility antigen, C alpha chain-like isoform X2 [Astyanax mexicanus]|uniref:saoe class I histocompatibility antigen, C alpha chain-like isoform X2 n=1 Tax=Astyanax mexicanus TaxID=7994 RepID=UPI0020CAFA0D|nr:saoe class I histocompatibility antigen, C alpha chain-like isoform X2 [Astyanax mexicanus]
MEDLNMTSTLLWSTLEVRKWICNCTWDDKSGDCSGYEKYGRNGKDFITLDVMKRSYISHTPEAIHITDLWNKDKARLESVIHHYTSACAKLVKISVPKLQRAVPPEVYLWQKNSSVVCLATGVYSKTTKVMWQKDSEDIHENVDEGETLCNGDGTFQKRSSLRVKPEEWKNHQYSCVVFDQNWKDKIIKNLTEEEIKKGKDVSKYHKTKTFLCTKVRTSISLTCILQLAKRLFLKLHIYIRECKKRAQLILN